MVARHSPLGWVEFGSTPWPQFNTCKVHKIQMETPIDLADLWTTERMGVSINPCSCNAEKLSQIEQKESKFIDDSCQKVDNQCLVRYPWKLDPSSLPDNKEQVAKKLEATERQLAKKSWTR